MKKYLILSFLFLLVAFPAIAKESAPNSGPSANQNPSAGQTKTTISPSAKPSLSPTGNQVKNENEVKTQNQGEDTQLKVETQENEQLNQSVDDSLVKVSDQVHQLIDTVGAKGGIGQEVKEIAQNQTKLQDQIKATFNQLNSRASLTKFFLGSDQDAVQEMSRQMDQNRLLIQQLEELKLQIKNSDDLQQVQQTIDLMTYQNTSLQNKIDLESHTRGLWGWFLNLFNK